MPKHMFEKVSFSARCAICAGISALFAFVCCLVMAAIANASDDPTKNLTLYGEICYGVTMMFCGFLGAKMGGEKRFACGAVSSGVLLLAIVISSFALGGNTFARKFVLAAIGALIASVGAILGSKTKKRRRR